MKRPAHADCDNCPRRKQVPVLPDAVPNAARCWVTDQPSQHDERTGHLLSGNTGITLARIWKAACDELGVEIGRSHIHVTAAALCPPVNLKDTKERAQAIRSCRPRLFAELKRLSPGAGILALGTDAHVALFGEAERIADYQGFTMKFDPEDQP